MDILGVIASVLQLVSTFIIVAVWLWRNSFEKRRLNQPVKVLLEYGGQTLTLPLELRRGDVTRAEVLGRLGMIPLIKSPRFSLSYTSKQQFLVDLQKVIEANESSSTLRIPCQKEEFEQFNLELFADLHVRKSEPASKLADSDDDEQSQVSADTMRPQVNRQSSGR
jgi:hypothetical protein